ncbi:MAG: hypothetical protein U9R15_08675 [Chloroflexota bacterium]|nr:hypothetical protein [Chloroflexota bacterium]
MTPKIKSPLDKIFDKAAPMIEEKINVLKEEAAEEFRQVNEKLDKIIELLNK